MTAQIPPVVPDPSDEVERPCVKCDFHEQIGQRHYCTGPHIVPDVVTGKPLAELPGARLFVDGVRRGWHSCGRTEAHHWKARAQRATERTRRFPWNAATFVVVCAVIGFMYFNGVPLCR